MKAVRQAARVLFKVGVISVYVCVSCMFAYTHKMCDVYGISGAIDAHLATCSNASAPFNAFL